MKQNEKNKEIKIYEALGVKKFKKFVLELGYRIFSLGDKNYYTREKYYKSSSNYRMKKGNGMRDLKDFKSMLLINGCFHFSFLLHNFSFILRYGSTLPSLLLGLGSLVINGYCVILQRYNWLRINHVLKKGEPVEESKKTILCQELEKIDSISDKCKYRVVEDGIITDITNEEFKASATLQQLKKYRDFLIKVKNDEENSKKDVLVLDTGKYLRLEYNPNKKLDNNVV